MGSKLPKEMRLEQCRSGLDDEAMLAALVERLESLRCLKQTEQTSTFEGTLPTGSRGEVEIILKIKRGGGLGEALKIAAGESQLHRQWRGAERLESAGIDTARGLALWAGRMGRDRLVAGVFQRLEGEDLLSLQRRGEVDGRLAREAGRLAGQVLRVGLCNRDQKPSNIIVLPDGRLGIVDTVGVRKLRPVERLSLRSHPEKGPGAAMLASLVLEPTGVGCPPRRTQCLRGLLAFAATIGAAERETIRLLWRAAAKLIEAHGDPTPRDISAE